MELLGRRCHHRRSHRAAAARRFKPPANRRGVPAAPTISIKSASPSTTSTTSYKKLPPSRYFNGYPTWFAIILPQVEEIPLQLQWRLDLPFYATQNKPVREMPVATFRCPSRGNTTLVSDGHGNVGNNDTLGAAGDYVGNAGNNIRGGESYWRPDANGTIFTARMFDIPGYRDRKWKSEMEFPPHHRRPEQDVPRRREARADQPNGAAGLACTTATTRTTVPAWPACGRRSPARRTTWPCAAPAPRCQRCVCDNFGSWHPGVCQFLFADGHVDAISTATDILAIDRMAVRNDGLVAEEVSARGQTR